MTIRHPIQLSSEQAKLLRDCLAYTLKNRPNVDRSEKLSAIPLLICLSVELKKKTRPKATTHYWKA